MSLISKYAVMGNPVSHSLSPRIHQMFARQCDIALQYSAIEVEEGAFQAAVSQFRDEGGKGLNITVPFKQQAWHLADQRSSRAELAGAVNTLKFNGEDSIFGDNTDGAGMLRDLTTNLAKQVSGARILIIGAGGAVRGVLGPLLEMQPLILHIANRTAAKARDLAAVFSEFGPCTASGLDELGGVSCDIVINGTAASLQGKVPDLPARILTNETLAYDMMYGKQATPFMLWASKNGVTQCSDGLGMLVEQAAESFFIWHGVKPDTKPVLQALR